MTDKTPETLRDIVEAAYEKTIEAESEKENIADSDDDSNSNTPENENTPSEGADESTAKSDDTQEEIEAPDHWSPEDIEVFKELDTKGRKLYLKRHKEMEAGYTKKSQALAEERKIAERFRKAIESHEEHLKNLGVDPFVAVNKLLETERLLRVGTPYQKSQALQKIIQDYGVNFATQNYPQAEQPKVDPVIQTLYDEVNRTRQYIARQEEERQNREVSSIEKQISDFSNSKDESGELKYPYFEDLRERMGKLIETGLASTLEEAYENAFALNKDLRKQYELIQDKRRKVEESNKQKIAASKKASFNVKSGSVSQISDPTQKLSTREILSRAYDAQVRV